MIPACLCHGPCDCHGQPMAWLEGDRHPRCTVTGHRMPNPFTSRAPVPTRYRPWRAPAELVRRAAARRRPA